LFDGVSSKHQIAKRKRGLLFIYLIEKWGGGKIRTTEGKTWKKTQNFVLCTGGKKWERDTKKINTHDATAIEKEICGETNTGTQTGIPLKSEVDSVGLTMSKPEKI